jgi:hypothetical protein
MRRGFAEAGTKHRPLTGSISFSFLLVLVLLSFEKVEDEEKVEAGRKSQSTHLEPRSPRPQLQRSTGYSRAYFFARARFTAETTALIEASSIFVSIPAPK